MLLNLQAFEDVINSAGSGDKYLTVGEEAIMFGKKGEAKLKADPLATLTAEDETKTAAKNFFIRQQLLNLIRNNLPEEKDRSNVQDKFFKNAEKKLFGAQDDKRNYIDATGVEDLSIADAKELLDGLSKANKAACENAKKPTKTEGGKNKAKLEDESRNKGGNNDNIIDIKHVKYDYKREGNVKIIGNNGDGSYDNLVINEDIANINNINIINNVNNDKIQKPAGGRVMTEFTPAQVKAMAKPKYAWRNGKGESVVFDYKNPRIIKDGTALCDVYVSENKQKPPLKVAILKNGAVLSYSVYKKGVRPTPKQSAAAYELKPSDLAKLLRGIADLKKDDKLTLGDYLQKPGDTSVQCEILRNGNLVGYAVIDANGNVSGSAPSEEDGRVGNIGITLAQFASVFNNVEMPENLRVRVWGRCFGSFKRGTQSENIKAAVEKEGIDYLEKIIKYRVKFVTKDWEEEELEKNGPTLDWPKEIERIGGVFTTSPANRRICESLLKNFHKWFVEFVESMKDVLPPLMLKKEMETGFRYLMFRDLACQKKVSDDPKEMFDKSALKVFASKGMVGPELVPMTLLILPFEKRQAVYAAVELLSDPITELGWGDDLFCRIVHHLDAVSALYKNKTLNAKTLFRTIFSDYGGKISESPKSKDFEAAFDSICQELAAKYPSPLKKGAGRNLPNKKVLYLLRTGKTIREIDDIMSGGKLVKPDKYMSGFSLGLSEFAVGINNLGKVLLEGDFYRPSGFGGSKDTFTFVFNKDTQDEKRIVSENKGIGMSEGKEEILDQVVREIEELCGPENITQINVIEAQMTQGGFAGELGRRLKDMNCSSNEHVALTFTLSKNPKNGDVQIHFSEPEGCNLRFDADVIVHTDGSSGQIGELVVENQG